MKEKIGIEKLIALLNEYLNDKVGYIQYHNENGFKRTPTKSAVEGDRMLQYEYVLGKSFGFVKWLVDNDKIDTDAYKTVYSGDLDKRKTLTMSSGGDEFYQVTEHGVYESLLMLLAIQENPIDFLCGILK